MTAPEIPAAIVEAAARAIFAQEQCDKRQAKDVPYQWNARLNEADHEEYRDLARAALAAAWPLIAAHVLNKAADVFEWARDDADYAAFQGWLRDRAIETRATAHADPTERTRP